MTIMIRFFQVNNKQYSQSTPEQFVLKSRLLNETKEQCGLIMNI